MNDWKSANDLQNDVGNDVKGKGELPEGQDYKGEKSFSEAFSDAINSFLESLGELIGVQKSKEAREVDETLSEKAADAMAEVFDQKTLQEWGTMTMEERQAKLSEYYSKLGQSLGIDAKGVIVEDCAATVGEGVLGYNSGDGYLHIDFRNLEDPSKLLDVLNTTTHEARHQLQSEAIADPSRFPEISPSLIKEWEHNMQNYDNGQFGFEGYYNQGVEVDARAFAGDVINGYKAKLGL
ncbi:MAG: hypothetical protein N2376_10625 [Clostridia bacterium]|nr:hypothetical protein [Clostridia bacterium]